MDTLSDEALARAVASRWGIEAADARQEVALAIWRRVREGSAPELARRYAARDLLSATRSPLRRGGLMPTRSPQAGKVRSSASDAPCSASEARAVLAQTDASWLGGFLDGLVASAIPRCPSCRRSDGWWTEWSEAMGDGVRQTDADRRRHGEALLVAGSPAVDEAGQRKARDTQVWWCPRCSTWTYEPLVTCGEGPLPVDPDAIVSRGAHGSADPERRCILYVAAGERLLGRRDDKEFDPPRSAPPGYPVDAAGRRRG